MRSVLFVLMVTVLVACKASNVVAPTSPDEFALAAEYANGAANYTLLNASSHNVGSNPCRWGLDRRVNSGWEELNPDSLYICTLVLPEVVIRAGEAIAGAKSLAGVEAGEYRLRADILFPPGDWTGSLMIFSSPFTVD